MRKHVETKHRALFDYHDNLDKAKKKKIAQEAADKEEAEANARYKQGSKEKTLIDKALCAFIAWDGRPPNTVQQPGFRMLCHALDPKYVLPTNTTVAAHTTSGAGNMWEDLREKTVRRLHVVKFPHYTSDMWTAASGQRFLNLHVHYCEADFGPRRHKTVGK